jgi:hypothetical protein
MSVLETHKLAKKNDTQPTQEGEEMLLHFPPKPNLKRKIKNKKILLNVQI